MWPMGRCCGCAESISRWPAVRPRSATETSWNRSPPNRPSRNQKQHNPTRRQLRNWVRSFGMNSPSRAGLRRCGAQLGVISVGPDSQSTCIKVCRIGCGAQLGVISVGPGSQSTCTKVCRIGRGAQLGVISVGRGPSQLAPRPVELGARPNWEQFWSAQVTVNLHQGL